MTFALYHRLVRVAGVEIATSVTLDEAERLRSLAHGRNVLEVGSAHGFSAITMADGGAQHVWAVDPHDGEVDRSLETMRANLRGSGYEDLVTMVLGRSAPTFVALLRAGLRFDLIFIDGDHSYDATRHDVQAAFPLLRPSGVLAVHDYGEISCPDVARAVDSVFPDGGDCLTDTLWEIRKRP